MALAALGILGPVAAAILHQVGSLLVLLNAMRLLAFGDWAELPPSAQLRAAGRRIRAARRPARPRPRAGAGASMRRKADRGRALALLAAPVRDLRAGRRSGRARSGWSCGSAGTGACSGRGCTSGWPPPFERVTRLEPGRVRSLEVGFRTASRAGRSEPLRWEASHGRGQAAADEDEEIAAADRRRPARRGRGDGPVCRRRWPARTRSAGSRLAIAEPSGAAVPGRVGGPRGRRPSAAARRS